MASATTDAPRVADLSKTKRPRKNPQRRKAERAKSELLQSNTPAAKVGSAVSLGSAGKSSNEIGKEVPPTTQAGGSIAGDTVKKLPSRSRLLKAQTSPINDSRAVSSPKRTTQLSPPPVRPTRTKSDSIALAPPALITGGLVGCAASSLILLSTHLWHAHSGPDTAILAARSAALCTSTLLSELNASLQHGTYSAEEALDILRRMTLAYASSVPGGASFVSKLFIEIDMLRKQRGREVDVVLRESYTELARASARGLSNAEVRNIVLRQLGRLTQFAGRGINDVVDRNPGLRRWRDDAVKSLVGPSATNEKPRNLKTPTIKLNMAVRQKA